MASWNPPPVSVNAHAALAHAVTWSLVAGKTYLTFIAKVSFALESSEAPILLEPDAVVLSDRQPSDPSDDETVAAAAENAPYLTEAALLFVGHARPPSADPRVPFVVRIALAGNTRPIDKSVQVRSASGSSVVVTDLAPRSVSAPARSLLLKTRAPRLDGSVLDLGREFDSRFWNPALIDQKTAFFRGGEALLVEGVHPEQRRVRMSLPALPLEVFCTFGGGARVKLPMSGDMLVIDGDTQRVSLIFRTIVAMAADISEVHIEASLPGVADPIPPPAPLVEPVRDVVVRRIAAKEALGDLDLRGADLSGLDLGAAKLAASDLRGASLERTKLDGADLRGANLAGCRMEQVSLSKAKLEGASLTRANLLRANLAGADLSRIEGEGASFELACCVKATFIGARLRGASFEKASLDEARFDDGDLEQANFTKAAGPEARFAGARLDGASLEKASFEGAAFSNASLRKVNMEKAQMKRALFDGADLSDANARSTRCGHAYFTGTKLEGADFSEADLSGATMTGALKNGAIFTGAKLNDVKE